MTDSNQPLPTIGWLERVDLPDWGLRRVRTKIDTGARTSAIDVAQIEHLDDGRIRFEVVGRLKPERRTRWIEATPVRTSDIRPSTGESQERFVCVTPVRIGDVTRDIEISLVCRQGMQCRMLLGRTAIAGHYVVDAASEYLQTRAPNRTGPKP
ncbi:MAG: RimK/LysX family protein [Planctomycetota bacterium]